MAFCVKTGSIKLAVVLFFIPYTVSGETLQDSQLPSIKKSQFHITQGGKQKPSQPLKKLGYIDQLIDPTIAGDLIATPYIKSTPSFLNINHTLEFQVNYRRNIPTKNDIYAAGLGYRAYIPTDNYGQFNINLIGLYEPENNINTHNDSVLSLGRYSLEQHQLPLTESLMMDNKIGTHKMSSRHLRSTHFISRRFTANEPDILGITSRLYQDNSSLTLSWGALGHSKGRTLQGFSKEKGKVFRAQIRQSFDKYLLTMDVWKSSEREDEKDNRLGYRATLDSLLTDTVRASITVAYSANNAAFLLGVEQHSGDLTQNAGGYYYDADFVWIDREISSNNTGVYYQFSTKNKAINYGGSIEWQRAGFDQGSIKKTDTFLLSSTLGYRINRQSHVNAYYRFRMQDDLDDRLTDNSSIQHSLRGFLNYRHTNDLSSHFQLAYRHTKRELASNSESSFTAHYAINFTFPEGENIDASIDYTMDHTSSSDNNALTINLGWQQAFLNDHQLTINGSYKLATNQQNNSGSININHQWYLSDQLSLSSNIGYNRSVFELDNNRSNALITDNDMNDSGLYQRENSELSASFSLIYQFGSIDSSQILAAKKGKKGSGIIRGRVFIDKNKDGIFQAGETGLASVELFLDSIYPIKTNTQGEFVFNRVGAGEHYIFIDETLLPLPWSTGGKEQWAIKSQLRSTSVINIPISTIGDNE
jgi:hypothetical protein